MAIRVGAKNVELVELQGMGNRIASLREQAGLSRRAFAQLSGLGEEHLRKIEDGLRTEISVGTLVRLCKALAVDADYILGLSATPLRRMT